MENNLGRDIDELKKTDIDGMRMLSFDGDGVTKKIGTDFIKDERGLVLESFRPSVEMIDILVELSGYFFININSGRSVEYLVDMYGARQKFVYLGEIGMFGWVKGGKYANFELTDYEKDTLAKIKQELTQIKDDRIKGFEPKNYLVTLHCQAPIEGIEEMVAGMDSQGELYCWWTGEAYDVGAKRINKATGLVKLCDRLGIKTDEVITIGHGVNDADMLDRTVGIDISTDADKVTADFVTRGEEAGGLVVVKKILALVKS